MKTDRNRRSSGRRPATLAALLTAGLIAAAWAPAMEAAPRRAGHSDLFFGLGAVDSDEAQIFGGVSLQQEQGNTIAIRWRLHFNDLFALETDLTHENGRVNLRDHGDTIDSADADTNYFLVNGVFDFVRGPISPFVSFGFGSFDHKANGILLPTGGSSFSVTDITEHGGVLDFAAGVDGRQSNSLAWLFEARYLSYGFSDFKDDWGRISYSGYIGISF
ncbi:MAG TPA: hypothetical protein VNI57_15235 [Candidatus Saccharimonadales bacterium]|nr:hypothetical protein [Candidatus Saccharimonadales bacterium]